MGVIKRIIYRILYRNGLKYAKKMGVHFPNGGHGCKLLTKEFGSEPWLISIGNHVELSGNVSFITHDGSTWCFRDKEKYRNVIRYGEITVGDNCFIGMNATILPNVSIGEGSIIGAGSVVTKNVEANSVYAGNPARRICSVEDFAEKCYQETPDYDMENYKRNKKDEVIKAYKISR